MNILSFIDVEQYLQFKQVYVVKDITNTDFQPIIRAGNVIDFKAVEAERINDNTISLIFNYNDTGTVSIYSYENDLSFFAFIKTHFIPVHLLVEKWYEQKLNRHSTPELNKIL